MNSIPTNIILFAAIISITSCDMHKVDCPAFNNEIMEWMPYEEGQLIVLKNLGANDTISLFVNSINISHATQYMNNEDCGTCDDYINICESYGNEENFCLYVHLNENELKGESYYIKGSSFDSYLTVLDYTDYDFNGTIYAKVKEYRNSSSDQGYTKLFVAKNYGIIGLEDENGNTWIRYPSADSVTKADLQLKITNTTCE